MTSPWDDKPFEISNEGICKPPERVWLLCDSRSNYGILPLGKVGQIIAAGGVGKTTVVAQLAVAVATGTPWMGTFTVATPGAVLLVVGEEDRDEIHRKIFYAFGALVDSTPEEDREGVRETPLNLITAVPLASVPSPMVVRRGREMVNGDFLEWLRTYIKAKDLKLIILDPMSRFSGEEAETSNAWATRFIQALELLAVESGATIIVAHHSNQSSRKKDSEIDSTSGRGVSALIDGMRWSMGMMREPSKESELKDLVTVSCLKSSYAPNWDDLVVKRDNKHGGALVLPTEKEERCASSKRQSMRPSALKQQEKVVKIESIKQYAFDGLSNGDMTSRVFQTYIRGYGCGTSIADDARDALVAEKRVYVYMIGRFTYYSVKPQEPIVDNVVPIKAKPGSTKL